jgi:hypothetical protein
MAATSPEDEDATPDLFGNLPVPTMPRTVRRVVTAGAEIVQDPPDVADFLHAVLCQVGMPRKQTAERRFERTSGGAVMRIEAGALFDGQGLVDYPLPYGTKPRLIMVHIGTQAVRTRSREVEIGHSTHDFMQTLGFDTNGRAYAMMKKQVMSLAACRLTLGMMRGTQATTVNTQPIEQFQAWMHPTGRQLVMWPGVIRLSEPFFSTMLEYAVPLDHRALTALRHSALALDIYTWLAHRLCRINKAAGVMVSWQNLHEQFGQEYGNTKDFKRSFRDTARQVCAVYPDAKLEETTGGLRLFASPPPVPKRQVAARLPE